MSDFRSISDDDLCAICKHCEYNPGEQSRCKRDWPGETDDSGYIVRCAKIVECERGANLPKPPKLSRSAVKRLDAMRRSNTAMVPVTNKIDKVMQELIDAGELVEQPRVFSSGLAWVVRGTHDNYIYITRGQRLALRALLESLGV